MPALDAPAVAVLLVELGRRTALAGDNYFQSKAYLRAADSLSTALYFTQRPPDPGAAEMRQGQLTQAEHLADGVDLKLALPFTMPRAVYAAFPPKIK